MFQKHSFPAEHVLARQSEPLLWNCVTRRSILDSNTLPALNRHCHVFDRCYWTTI